MNHANNIWYWKYTINFFVNRYRQVDPAKLNTLKDLINAPNYKDNLATLIRTIYEFAFLTYAGKVLRNVNILLLRT